MLAAQKLITRKELDQAFEAGSGIKNGNGSTKEPGMAAILSCIGGVVVFIGIVILLAENWATLGFGTKVLATLGAGIAAYLAGIWLGRNQRTETIASVFCILSAAIIPLGIGVVIDHAGFDVGSAGSQSLLSGILFGSYLSSCLVWRKKTSTVGHVLLFCSIFFGTWLYFSLTSFVTTRGRHFDEAKFFEYRLLVAGMVYMLLSRAFSKGELASLQDFPAVFGIIGFMGAALALGGWKPAQNVFWELSYPVLVFGALFLSIQLKSKAYLGGGTFFLMAFIMKITWEYFSNNLGWPLTLIIAGLTTMGAGYMSLGLKRKYWQAQTAVLPEGS